MFVVKPRFEEDWEPAIFMLSYYHVSMQIFSDGDDPRSSYMVVDSEDYDAVRMAEMCFQMNWRQVGHICPHCEDEDIDDNVCGHLTFDMPIEKRAYVE